MKSRLAPSNQIVQLQPQREQGRMHLFQLHNAEKGQAKLWTTNGKLANRGRLSMGCYGSTIHKQRGSWIQRLPGYKASHWMPAMGESCRQGGSAGSAQGSQREPEQPEVGSQGFCEMT
ncbi:hypothetical protein JOB18_033066 [Xyrichtys novacula]|uniref:Uncharacterized protein n=1 Tax=Xyrichtys novacula TaxID=13765 RepID=A0AAV1EXD3_XYRNO|nr:hypothetical protein JOB18_033066 [Xyrichtys novacula]